MDASTSQDITDAFVPITYPKTSLNSNSPTISEQLHLMTTQVDQLRITLEQSLEQTKPLVRTFPLANMKQFPYLHSVQHLMTQLSVDLEALNYTQLFARWHVS